MSSQICYSNLWWWRQRTFDLFHSHRLIWKQQNLVLKMRLQLVLLPQTCVFDGVMLPEFHASAHCPLYQRLFFIIPKVARLISFAKFPKCKFYCKKINGLSRHLFIQNQHWKRHSNVWKPFKVSNKDTKTTPKTRLRLFYNKIQVTTKCDKLLQSEEAQGFYKY